MPHKGSNAFVFIHPLNGTFGCVIVPCGVGTIVQEVDSANRTHFAGRLFQILEFLFVILDEIGRICVQVVVMRAAVLLLSGNDMLSVLVAEILIQPLSGI